MEFIRAWKNRFSLADGRENCLVSTLGQMAEVPN